ncbi:PAS domain S-box-containing protein [Rhodoferax ferrireducens]|uniref:histidine kinase n=1 Tax=Rhodoferax ferrireducens TaxID=192843 RepID=A0ABU2C733_9BURK|nr:PAS domain S-box protein [Rhodoferax ferrireducens]MDR7377137.1 PAS domain S-box-containing protein [Rhodoferax ferrireducens]
MSISSQLDPKTLQDAHYRRMVNAVVDYAIFFIDLNGLVVSWNAGARKLKGYEAHEVVGGHISLFYPAELIERRWPEHELNVARIAGRMEDEGWRLRKDGTRFWANIVITRLDGEDGTPMGFVKITRDLTERRRQEELLRHSEERFRLLVEGVHDYAIFMLDPSGYVISWNRGAQQTKGYEASEIIGKHFSVFYPPDQKARGWPDQELQYALRDGHFEDEGWRVRKDGTRFWASVVITALRDASGTHRGFAKVTRDLTERRRVRALEDEGRRITHFLAMLGHELRNPLAPISNAVALLEREANPSKVQRMSHEIIGRQLKQLIRLVDDLLDVGRITSGKIHLESQPVRLRDALRDALETVQPLSSQKGHVIEISDQDADVWVLGDKARLIQVLSNLLHNAVKFTPIGGHIGVRISASGAHADILVKDDGPGIPPQQLQNIFELFVQGEQDSARSLGGLGLGLSLVQELVALHGGSISAFSTGRSGEGAEFLVQLPAVEAPKMLMELPVEHDQGNEALLIVDDNRDAADTLSMLLEALGYQTSVVCSGTAAIEAVKVRPWAAVLLDIGMSDLSGLQVADEIRKLIANPPPLIAVTGYGQEGDRMASREAGFLAHLTKPVDIDTLHVLLQQLLKDKKQPRSSPSRRG